MTHLRRLFHAFPPSSRLGLESTREIKSTVLLVSNARAHVRPTVPLFKSAGSIGCRLSSTSKTLPPSSQKDADPAPPATHATSPATEVTLDDNTTSPGPSPPFLPREWEQYLDKLRPLWQLNPSQNAISRTFVFHNFRLAWTFMTKVTLKVKTQKHFPRWTNDCTKVHVTWTTPFPDRLSLIDFKMAQYCDKLAQQMDSKSERDEFFVKNPTAFKTKKMVKKDREKTGRGSKSKKEGKGK